MPTDSYSCKCLKIIVLPLTLLFVLNCKTLASNNFTGNPSDSTLTRSADSTSANLIEWLKPSLRSDVVQYAKRYLGTPYRYAGRSSSGFDCSGFTHYVMKNFDINVSGCSRTQGTQGTKIALQATKPGDLIFFRRSSRSRISHVAMVVANNEQGIFIIHSTSRGVVVDNLMKSKYWRPKIYMARDVATPFVEKYAVERAQQLLAQQAKLKSMQLDLALLAKAISI